MSKVRTADALLMFRCIIDKSVEYGVPKDKKAEFMMDVINCYIEFLEDKHVQPQVEQLKK